MISVLDVSNLKAFLFHKQIQRKDILEKLLIKAGIYLQTQFRK